MRKITGTRQPKQRQGFNKEAFRQATTDALTHLRTVVSEHAIARIKELPLSERAAGLILPPALAERIALDIGKFAAAEAFKHLFLHNDIMKLTADARIGHLNRTRKLGKKKPLRPSTRAEKAILRCVKGDGMTWETILQHLVDTQLAETNRFGNIIIDGRTIKQKSFPTFITRVKKKKFI
ncbi:hypothetical protein SCT_3210 [Sulfuricella sp. T08]|uniref:hypothetical protein n=1 Tax=Sulfuricella sp. T08 TaxID=1632857 RepID=UPI0006179CE6|nr:hypothetical protein [Sulfuricella sp. T08]GAO37773.1 hypothetical protein SCT_3210 [Sulfuricella sp. T08]